MKFSKPFKGIYKCWQEYGKTAWAAKHPAWYPDGTHHGIDFGLPAWTPLYAAHDGYLQTYYTSCRGNYVTITKDEYKTIYMHLSRFAVTSGSQIKRGQLIGYSGNSGTCSSGAHLHFGFYIHGKSINPRHYIDFNKEWEEEMKKWKSTIKFLGNAQYGYLKGSEVDNPTITELIGNPWKWKGKNTVYVPIKNVKALKIMCSKDRKSVV